MGEEECGEVGGKCRTFVEHLAGAPPPPPTSQFHLVLNPLGAFLVRQSRQVFLIGHHEARRVAKQANSHGFHTTSQAQQLRG